MVDVIAKATDITSQNNGQVSPEYERLRLRYNGYTAILVKGINDNNWLLTGWENEKEATAYAEGEVNDSSDATAAMPTPTRHDGGNAITSFNPIISKNRLNSQEENNISYSRDIGEVLNSQSETLDQYDTPKIVYRST